MPIPIHGRLQASLDEQRTGPRFEYRVALHKLDRFNRMVERSEPFDPEQQKSRRRAATFARSTPSARRSSSLCTRVSRFLSWQSYQLHVPLLPALKESEHACKII